MFFTTELPSTGSRRSQANERDQRTKQEETYGSTIQEAEGANTEHAQDVVFVSLSVCLFVAHLRTEVVAGRCHVIPGSSNVSGNNKWLRYHKLKRPYPLGSSQALEPQRILT